MKVTSAMTLGKMKNHTVERDGCWIWTGAKSSNGYGMLRINDKTVSAHRTTYRLANGPIPEGLVIDHLCRTPLCCNPEHLEAVTMSENILRASKPTCPHGHEMTPENTYRGRKSGSRSCRKCMHARVFTARGRVLPSSIDLA